MIDLMEQTRTTLEDLCRRHHVRTLEVFGSAANGTFDLSRSDLDFLAEFLPLETKEYADAYFGLLFGLEDLFQRKIDLVIPSVIENRYFLKAVNEQRQILYAA
jgi:uncharacterized protein